jgi:two-component system invasion response regulator UvrY
LLTAVHKVISGHKYISSSIAEKMAESLVKGGEGHAYSLLSDRELQVLQMVARGNSVKEIADQLTLSPATIATYRSRLLGKLMWKSNVELTQYAIHNNLIE